MPQIFIAPSNNVARNINSLKMHALWFSIYFFLVAKEEKNWNSQQNFFNAPQQNGKVFNALTKYNKIIFVFKATFPASPEYLTTFPFLSDKMYAF